MLVLAIRVFVLAALLFPACAGAQLAALTGSYSGTFSGGDSGTWSAAISSNGAVSVTIQSSSGQTVSGNGQVGANNALTVTTGGTTSQSSSSQTNSGNGQVGVNNTSTVTTGGTTSNGGAFNGAVDPATGAIAGTWSNPSQSKSGVWSGSINLPGQTMGEITFSPSALAVGGSIKATAYASSGLAVSFSSTTPAVCSVSGNTVSAIATGVCTIAANQAGDARYNPAPEVTQSIAVAEAVIVVSKAGTGSGTVSSADGSIDCGNTCSASYASATSVILTAAPDSGSTFAGWGGACAGSGTCSVSVGVAKDVSATFNRVPFTAVTTGVTAGLIKTPVATVTTKVTFNAVDVGKRQSVFVTAWAPLNTLSPAQRVRIADYTLLRVYAQTTTTSFALVQLTSSGWQPVVNGQLIPYVSGVLGDQSAAISILDNTDTSKLLGSQFCVGYGTSATEMAAAGRMQLLATIPNQSATKSSSGSCNVAQPISDARVFAYAEANYASLFAGAVTSGQYLQYDYRYYADTQNYLAVDTSGTIFILGPVSNDAVIGVGPVESFRDVITKWEGVP